MDDVPYTVVEPEEAHRALTRTPAPQLVDVREASEIPALRVEGALNLPLSRLRELAGTLDRNRSVYLLCRSGARAASAAAQLRASGHRDVLVVRGGIEGWIQSGKPVVRGTARVWSLERQVRFTAGVLVFAGVAAGARFGRLWLILPAAVGLGLAVSAAADFCGLALVLARMPWNRGSAPKR